MTVALPKEIFQISGHFGSPAAGLPLSISIRRELPQFGKERGMSAAHAAERDSEVAKRLLDDFRRANDQVFESDPRSPWALPPGQNVFAPGEKL